MPWPTRQQIYDASPRFIQRVLVNLEAYRRERYRRYGDYEAEVAKYDPSWYVHDLGVQEAYQVKQVNELLQTARRTVPHYRQSLPDVRIESLEDMQRLPLLAKDEVRYNPRSFVREDLTKKDLWLRVTSGSTGTPLGFYHDRTTTRAHQAVADALFAMHGCPFGKQRVRFSGAYVTPYGQKKPPFWMYVSRYKQLQCSSYHLGPDNYRHYLEAMRAAKVTYGTGYATAWHLLASYVLDSGDTPPPLKAIFTDSEGINLDQQAAVERAFGCPVFQTYGLGEVCQLAIQCSKKRYHVLTRSCITEILDEEGKPVQRGETGEVVVTDLVSPATPYIRYRTGDLATLAPDECTCGWHSPSWTEVVGRVDDRIKTPEGRWIGRLSHVIKPAVGVRESQIVQVAVDRIVIRVVPDRNFEPASMDACLAAAHRYLGDSMNISWERVERLKRTRARRKLRHVVRLSDSGENGCSNAPSTSLRA